MPGRDSNDGVVIGERVFGVADGDDDGVGTGRQALFEVVRLLGPRPRARDLRPALHAANFALWYRDDADRLVATVTIAVWSPDRVAIGHIGDSRAYLVRDGCARQLTTDHLVDDTDHEGVTRLGRQQAVPELEVVIIDVRDGDRLVLCTDGLWRSLQSDTLAKGVRGVDPSTACATLCRHAQGNDEEVSVVVVAFADRAARNGE